MPAPARVFIIMDVGFRESAWEALAWNAASS
jgi:hypothetical protein